MLTLFKKLLGRSEPKVTASVSSAAQHEPSAPIPTVEVAHLSLAAIVSRLPEEIRGLVRQEPGETATVALPVPTILKQLPAGAVKMSLASLHRQAPTGLFSPIPPGDKRMVSVPLGEIFRHVSPYALKRRTDQRTIYLPPSGFNLFGNSENPYEIVEIADEDGAALTPETPAATPPVPRFAPTDAPAPRLTPAAAAGGPRVIAPPPEYFEPTPRRSAPAIPEPPPKPKSDLPPLRLPLAPLTDAWPDEIKGELTALNGSASVLLPADDVSAGLAKGKVAFTWGEICSFLEPALPAASAVPEATPLTLPLKVVAPAFLAVSKPAKPDAKKVKVAADIPALFSGAPAVPAPAAEPETVAESEPAAEPTAESVPTPDAAPVEEAVPTPEVTPVAEAEPVAEVEPTVEAAAVPASEPAPAPIAEVAEASAPEAVAPPETPPQEAPAAEHPAVGVAAVPSDRTPESIGQIFGEPDKQSWTPGEIVSRLAHLPGIAGAVVALQEGLLVAQVLPDDVKGEVVAAFLPQIFARLNLYAGEMKLGEVDDLLFTTRGAHCQIYRLGFVYFAVLGKPGESLPWHELRLIAEELAKQTQPA